MLEKLEQNVIINFNCLSTQNLLSKYYKKILILHDADNKDMPTYPSSSDGHSFYREWMFKTPNYEKQLRKCLVHLTKSKFTILFFMRFIFKIIIVIFVKIETGSSK